MWSRTGASSFQPHSFAVSTGEGRDETGLSREEEAHIASPPHGFQSTLQMRSSWARHDLIMLLDARSQRRSSPPKHPVRSLESCTRQHEMGRSLPNWELSTQRFYSVSLACSTDAILIPQLFHRLLVLGEKRQVGLFLLLLFQSLFASTTQFIPKRTLLNRILEDDLSCCHERFAGSLIYGFLLFHFFFLLFIL